MERIKRICIHDYLLSRLSPSLFRCVLASLLEALSVRWSVGPSVGPSVGWSVTLSSKSMKNGLLRILNDLEGTGRGRKRDVEEGGTRRKEGRGGMRRKERRG